MKHYGILDGFEVDGERVYVVISKGSNIEGEERKVHAELSEAPLVLGYHEFDALQAVWKLADNLRKRAEEVAQAIERSAAAHWAEHRCRACGYLCDKAGCSQHPKAGVNTTPARRP